MRALITTYKRETASVKLLFARLDSRLFYITQDWDSDRLRALAKKYQGYDGFELHSGRGQIVEVWQYAKWESLDHAEKEAI